MVNIGIYAKLGVNQSLKWLDNAISSRFTMSYCAQAVGGLLCLHIVYWKQEGSIMNTNRVMKTGQSESGGRFTAMLHRACMVIQSAGRRAIVEGDPVHAGSASGRSPSYSQPLAVGQRLLSSGNSRPLNQPPPASPWPLSPPPPK